MQLKSEEILTQKRLIFDLIENSIRKQSLSLLPGNTGRHSCRTKTSADVLENLKSINAALSHLSFSINYKQQNNYAVNTKNYISDNIS